jgi:hypothetical protein
MLDGSGTLMDPSTMTFENLIKNNNNNLNALNLTVSGLRMQQVNSNSSHHQMTKESILRAVGSGRSSPKSYKQS